MTKHQQDPYAYLAKEAKTKDELYTNFKHESMPIFKWLGISQGVLFGLMILGAVLTIWVNMWLILKAEATCYILACIAGIVYNHLNKFVRKQFD